MANRNLSEIRADNPPAALDNTELHYAVQAGDDTALTGAELRYLPDEELTADRVLAAADCGRLFYVLDTTSADITITYPGSLGAGFHCMWNHEGTGVLDVAGTDIEPPPGGTLNFTAGGYGSLTVNGADALVKVQGTSEAAP